MNQNYNFVRGLFSQETNTRKEELTTKTGTYFKSLLLLVVFAFFASISMQGQSTANYAFNTYQNQSLVDMSSGTTQLLGGSNDDAASSVVNIGFSFYFMGTGYSQFSANSNGQMRLGSTPVLATLQAVAANAPLIVPMSGDNYILSTGKVHYKLIGTSPNQVLVVEWLDLRVPFSTSGVGSVCQALIYQFTGVVEFIYGTVSNNVSPITTRSIFISSSNIANTVKSVSNAMIAATDGLAPTVITLSDANIALISSATNTARRMYRFTPPAASADPTTLTFTAVTTTTTTPNWLDASTTESGWVVTRATDAGFTTGVVTATVASTTSAATGGAYTSIQTGLTPGTTYYYKIQALNEALLSSGITGSQATPAAATYYWVGATGGNWSIAANWNTAADNTGATRVASLTTDILIVDGAGTTPGAATTINVDIASFTIGQFKVTSNTSATLQSSVSTTRTITVLGSPGDDFVVESGSTLNLTNATQAAAFAFSGTGNTGLIAGTLNFAGSTTNVITTTGGTSTLVTVPSTGVVNLGAAGNTLVGSATTLTFENGSNCNSTGATTGAPPVPLATWGATSNLTITGVTTSSGSITNNAQSFGNVTYNCPSALASMSFWTSTSTAVVKGDLTINATNRGRFRATTSGTVTINGNLILNGGTFEVASTSGTVKVLGNVIQNGGRLDITSGSSTASLLVAGQFNQVAGDLLVSGSSSTNKIEFNGTSAQNVTLNGTTNGAAVFRVNNPSGINLTGIMNINAKGGLVISNGNITGSGSVVYIPTHNYTSAVGANNTYESAAGATSATTTITVASTDGLQQGMTVSVSAGVGVFAANTTVSAITSATTFTVSTAPTTALSGGATIVSASGGSVINVQSTVGLQPGMTVAITAGNGVFAASTTISAINTATSFTVSAAPTTALSGGATVVTGTNTGVNTLTYNGAVAQTSNALEFPATNGPAALTVNNTATAPNNVVTVPFTRTLVGTAGTLTLTAGILDNSTYVLTVPNTAVTAVSAGSATAYMKGALERGLLPGSISTTPSVYSFPVGKSGFNPFALVNPTTSATGEVSVKAEVFDAATGGTNGTLIGGLNTNRYWAASITNGSANFTNALIKLSDVPNSADAIARSATLTGAYDLVGGVTTTATASSLQSTTPEVTTLDGYYVMALKAAATLATPAVTPSGNQCTNVARAISVLITPGGGAINTVVLNYSVNGVAQTAINMTNSTLVGGLSADTWTATIPTVTPTNANITWSITATDANSLTRSVTGTAYTDEPNLGLSATAAASLATVCAGSSTSLNMTINSGSVNITEGFEGVAFPPTGWTILNAGSGNNWITSTTPKSGTKAMQYSYNGTNAANTWMFTTAQQLLAGKTYTISFWYNTGGGYPEKLKVTAGTAATTASQTNVIWSNTNLTNTTYAQATATFVAPTSGTYYFAFNCFSIANQYNLYVDDISITGGANIGTPTYSWSDGTSVVGTTNPLVVNPTITTTYTGTAIVNDCPINATTSVTAIPLPTAPSAINSTQCGTQIPTASVGDTNSFTTPTFKWYDALTGGTVLQTNVATTYLASISATTTFYVVVVDPVSGCESPRSAVTVSVSTPDAISATASSTSICIGQSVTLTTANSATTPAQTYAYSWLSTANSGVETSQAGSSITATPIAAGSYTYTASALDGLCQTTNTVIVSVNTLPVITTATANPNVACVGSTINLAATINEVSSGSSTIGAGAATSSTYSNPFYSLWSNNHTQHLITAAELTAMGLSSGNITSVGLNVTSAGSLPMINFSVKIGTTSSTSMTAFVSNSAFQTVYTSASLMPITGVNTLTFSTPFNWDGTSNLVLEFCHGNSASSATMSRTVQADNTSYVSTVKSHISAATASTTTCGDTSTNLISYSARPVFIFGGQVVTNTTLNYNWSWNSTPAITTAAGTTVLPAGATTTYTVTATNSTTGCSATQDVTVSTAVSALALTGVTPASSNVCVGGSVTLTGAPTGGCIPYLYSWSDGTSIVGTTPSISVSPTSTKTYTLTVTDNGGVIVTGSSTITVNNPQPTSVAGETKCATSATFALGATVSNANNLLDWYAEPTGGSVLASGATFTTPSLSAATTTYYVEENELGTQYSSAKASPTNIVSDYWTNYGIVFNASKKVKLNEVTVYATSTSTSNITIKLLDNTGTQVPGTADVIVDPTDGTGTTATIVPLNYIIPAGSGYRLVVSSGMTSTNKMVQETAAIVYPYTNNSISVIAGSTGTASNSTSGYYWFYDLKVSDICTGLRAPVVATLNTPPVLILGSSTATICSGQSTTSAVAVTSLASSFNTYTWSPSPTSVSGDEITGWIFSPSVSTTYTLTASDGTCSNTATFAVTVNPLPTTVTIAPTSASVCVDTVLPLVATGGTISSSYNFIENFNGATMPAGWVTYSPTTTSAVIISASANAGGTANELGLSFTNATTTETDTYYASMPVFNASALNSLQLNFKYLLSNYSATTYPYVFKVQTSSDNTNWSDAFTFTPSGGTAYTAQNQTVSLSGLQGISTAYVRFAVIGRVFGCNYVAIDDVNVTGIGSVPTATTWTPIANLYTDLAATTPYTLGTSATTVYFKSSTVAAAATYTATATSVAGCTSTATVPVTVNANTTLALTSANATQTVCEGTAIANIVYTVTNGTGVTATLPSGLSGALVGNTYTISGIPTAAGAISVIGTGLCISSSALTGTISINSNTTIALASATATQTVCSGVAISDIVYTVTNGTGVTATLPTGLIGTYLGGTYTISGTPTASGTITVSGTGLCTASAALTGDITVSTTAAPTGAATQSLSSLLTVGDIVVVGTAVVWYASSSDAASGTSPLSNSQLLANTTYYATQTVAGCTSTTSLEVTITTLANQDFDMTQFSYYPNPVIDLLNVSYSQDMTNVKVFNMIGQQLLNKDINATTTQIDMSGYANGAYFIQVSTENAMKTVRVIKK